MKKYLVFIVALVLCACQGEGEVLGEFVIDEELYSENILLILGEGGPSGNMFVKAAHTYQKENGGDIYEVHSGDEFVAAVRDYLTTHEKIGHLEYFGHGNNVGLYVNQLPNVNGGMYANDPYQNEDWLAASFYDLDDDIFAKWGWIKFNGCNVAEGYPDEDTLAQRVANYFDVDVVAPMGPTEFSSREDIVDPIPNSNFLDSTFDGDVYMVSTYGDKGFVVVHPMEPGASEFKDVREGHDFQWAVAGLAKLGLDLGFEDGMFLPYFNTTYGDAVEFCRVAFGDDANCFVDGYEDGDPIRNLKALQMLVDAKGVDLAYTDPWFNSYIWWASQRDLLTEDFVNKKWYTRAEMAELTWNFIAEFDFWD